MSDSYSAAHALLSLTYPAVVNERRGMPSITLRTTAGQDSPGDIKAEVKENTFNYLMEATVPKVRVSAYLEQD